MQCTNNLKQMGIAIHNFHDTNNGIPPLHLCTYRRSFFGAIFPYIEQQALYDLLENTKSDAGGYELVGKCAGLTGQQWWQPSLNRLTDGERAAFGSVSAYLCPSRARSKPAVLTTNDSKTMQGPQTDYAMACSASDISDSSSEAWWSFSNEGALPTQPTGVGASPFRTARCTVNPDYTFNSWQPRDTFSWWRDGMSNQICIGEKNFSNDMFPVGNSSGADYQLDGSYLQCHPGVVGTITRVVHDYRYGTYLASGTNDNGPNGSDPYVWFGTPHPGICNFLFGDGSVHAVSSTTSSDLLAKLVHVSDGDAVTLP